MSEPRRRMPGWIVGLAIVAIVVAAGAYLLTRRPAPPPAAPPPAAAPAPAAPPQAAGAPSLQEAFAIAYPEPAQAVTWDGRTQRVRFSPVTLVPVNADTFALVSAGRSEDDCHSCQGFYSVAYLTGYPLLKLQAPPVLDSASVGGFGEPPRIETAPALSGQPTLVVRSSFGAQGITEEWADLVRLGERPAVVARRIPLRYDDTDAGGGCAIRGTIKPGPKDQAFAVVYQGDWTRAVTWTWNGEAWRTAEPAPKLGEKCPGGAA